MTDLKELKGISTPEVLEEHPMTPTAGLAALLLALAATPAEQFKAIRKEYDTISGGGPFTDGERLKFIGKVYRHRNKSAVRFLELAEKHPDDPVAIDALLMALWQVNTTPWPIEVTGDDPARPKAAALLIRRHIRDAKFGALCQRVSHGFAKEYEGILRAALEKSPHEEVRALACLGLARFMTSRAARLTLIRDEPALGKEFAGLYGEGYLAAIQKRGAAKAAEEAEALYGRAAETFGKVKIPDGGTVGEAAKAALFEARHLSVGREAPDIEGQDQDGRRFKLSGYRGKVVLLDFWHQQ